MNREPTTEELSKAYRVLALHFIYRRGARLQWRKRIEAAIQRLDHDSGYGEKAKQRVRWEIVQMLREFDTLEWSADEAERLRILAQPQSRLIPLTRPDEANAAGIPVETVDQLRWMQRTAEEKGLRDAFVRIGRRVFLDPRKFHELVRLKASSP